MAVAIASVSNDVVADTSDTHLTPSAPSGTAVGDLLVAHLTFDSARTVTPPSGGTGWTLLISKANSSKAAIYAKIAESADTSGTYDFAFDLGFNAGQIHVKRITGGPSDVADIDVDSGPGNSGADSSAECSNISITSDNSLVIYQVSDTGSSSSLASWNEGRDYDDTVTQHLGVYDSTGNSGTFSGPTITVDFVSWATVGIAIPPAAAPAGRTTKNTRSHPLGVSIGTNWRVTG